MEAGIDAGEEGNESVGFKFLVSKHGIDTSIKVIEAALHELKENAKEDDRVRAAPEFRAFAKALPK